MEVKHLNIKKIITNFDYVLFAIILVLFGLGLLAIASATNINDFGITRQVQMQAISFVIGLVAIAVLLLVNYEMIGELYWWFYGITILLLVIVFVPGVGVTRFGATSWINLGPIDFQTSEIAKITYIIFLSKFVDKSGGVKSLKDLIKAGLTLIPILALLLRQPDLGHALVFTVAAFGVLLINGMKYWIVALGVGGAAGSIPLIFPRLELHQQQRIEAFLNPNDVSLPGNYQVLQSKITLGSGQMYGRGLFQGVYHRLNYLPVQESDFIFAVFVEETGFVGGIAVIALYLFFLLRMVTISRKIKDNFGSSIIIGLVFMFAFQIIENIAMTMGKMPVTGITLPFFSYGATSIVTNMIAIGIIESIYIRRKKGTFFTHEY
ncbi:MAG TPA: rod shape-determining protein RodA [Clostridiales bacterium UBA8960]|nr:rod shape-determining protein RodA [Clostridiales bacterium UBA8960]